MCLQRSLGWRIGIPLVLACLAGCGGTLDITAQRIPALPASCEHGGTTTNDPEVNFEVRHVDWQAQYRKYRPNVTATTTEDELFQIMTHMLKPLDDFHVSLAGSGTQRFSAGTPPTWSALAPAYISVIRRNYLHGTMRLAANGQLWYGKLSDRVGYLHVRSMEGFADTLERGKTVLADDLDGILHEFHDLDALIVDIRSDILSKRLPNGWMVGLSNQVYTAADGEVYERLGLPPDIEVPMNPDGFRLGKDSILEHALDLAGRNPRAS